MQFFKQLTDPALKRLYKFVLKRLIGRFLAEDEIDLDQLDVHLRSGRLELCDLLLNADMLNAEICEAHGLPFRVKKGYLGSVRVTISYMNIMSESCLVEIDDIEIVLVPVGEEDDPKAESKARGTATKHSSNQSKQEGGETQQGDSGTRGRGNSNEYTDEVSQEGLDFVASWIEQVTSKIKVTLSNICLRLETSDAASGEHVALLCKLEWAQFTDESASEVASVYGRGGTDQSFGTSSQNMHQSMAASSLFGISQKAVKFRGISMDLLLPSDELEEDDSGSVLHHFLASDSTRQCYVQLKLSHYEALEAPTVDADLFLHSIRVVLQPQHFSYFGTLIDAFGDKPPPQATKHRYNAAVSMYASICESKPAWLEQDDQDQSNEGGMKLSLPEFQRIEQLLLHYHKTHEELMNAQRDGHHDGITSYERADFPYPVPRRLSSAESVESVGLSDLEDDENFFECDPGAESMVASARFGGASNMMAQSMYASALYEPEETNSTAGNAKATGSLRASVRHRASKSVRSRVKIHLLECDIVILYDDLLDLEDDEDDGADYSLESRRQRQLRRRRRGLPVITDQERIEVIVKDVILSTLVYQSYTTVALSVGTFEIVEKMLARMSIDIEGDEDSLLTIPVLRFADVSPATSRKVHLSANLSAQIRIDVNSEGVIDLLAVQVSAQPILLEWDMHIVDRAHRLMKLMEESSSAKQKKKSIQPDQPELLYPKKLDVNTECVEITLRFPMVNSDLVRFGPSSRRGLSEDKLVLMLEGVKANSYADGAESESLPSTSSKPKLPWLSEFDVRFDTVSAILVSPAGGDQRSSELTKSSIISGRSDMTSGDGCRLRVRMQVPTNEAIRSALAAKHMISQDSLEQYIEATTNAASEYEEKSGDDNDGGRVGSNGWSQDARNRAHDFEVAASGAALIDLEIRIPHSRVVFDKNSFDRLMILFDALMMINPIDVNGHNQMMATAAYRNRLIPSYMAVAVELNDGTLQLEYAPPPSIEDPSPSTVSVYHIAFQDFRVFQVSQWMGQLVSRVHVAAQNVTLVEEDRKSKVASPVMYKNPIGVNDAPVLFVGIDIVDQTQEMREMKVELHVSQVHMRYDVSSKWMIYLSELLLLEYPPPIIPLDSASTTPDEYDEILQLIRLKAYETVKLAVPPKTVFTKLFVSFYDAIVDYAPTTLSSRIMLVLGNVSVSSNVVTGALIQGYKISVRDVQLFLTPDRPTYAEFDDSILGNELLAATNKNKKRAVVSFTGESRSRGQLSSLYPSQLMFFEKHGFLQMVTVDFIDVFLRAIVPPVEPTIPQLSSERKVSPSSLGAPELSVELTLGTANIYACFDSFNSLIEVISVWTEQLSVEGEPRDTTAYVGLDRVKDVSSVSVVTNLGPATVRSSRPSVDESSSQTLPLTSARLAAQNALINDRGVSHASQISRTHSSSSRTATTGINLFAQLDENAFGSGRRVFSGSQATTDTEARLLRTRLDEIQKEKDRMVSGASDDTMSAAELRRKYNKQEGEPVKPKMRINELFIEDYYSGNGVKDEGDGNTFAGAGDFLMSSNVEAVQTISADNDDPWFASKGNHYSGGQAGGHPVGSLPDEHSARWLGHGAFDGSAAASSPSSSPRFDPVDENTFVRELKHSDAPMLIDGDDDADSEDDEFPSGGFPAGPKNWWGMQSPQDVELSELQTEETESSFSHHLPFMDDASTQEDANEQQHPLSMSMMIGNGEDEGTEVELDFTLDREMQSKFDRLMELDSSDGRDVDDLDDEDEEEENSDAGFQYQQQAIPLIGSRRPSKSDVTAPVSIPPRRTSFSDHSSHSGVASAIPSLFSPPDEPTARWFYDDLAGNSGQREGPPSRIYPHHVEIPIGGTAASLSFGERECDEAIRSVAREATATKNAVTSPVVIRHVLLRDFNICMRFFGGSDWSKDVVNVPTLTRRGPSSTSAAPAARPQDDTSATKERKDKLLGALLDNYVPSPELGLFGSESTDSSLFGGPSRSRVDVRTNADRSSSSLSSASRKRSLKSGRKTEEMLELVVTRIQLRLDVFNEEECQPLASNTVLAFGDMEILDYISTSQIRKIICYWKSDASHPRESGSSMVHVHLMTVRPGPNLCEEHRLRVRMLPLRVNLDQEVVSFLRQFVPTEAGGRGPDASLSPMAEEDDEGEGKFDIEGTELAALTSPAASKVTETDVSLGTWFFQSIDIRPCKIKIDYRPNRVDFEALRAGDYLEVINLFVLEGMELVLRRVKASGIDGWSALGEHVLMSWVNDISRHQIHKCVASVSMPPLRPFANIGSGAADLILLPLEHYGRDRRLVRGIKKGAKSFLKSVTIETLNTASKVAQGTQALLEHADDVVSSTSSRKKHIKYRQPGSRIARNSKSMGGGGIRSAQDRGGIGNRQYLAQQPSNATEGFYQAYDSLSRELHMAAKTIVAVPLIEYKKTGSQGYVRSVIRAVPVAVLRPMIGASEAMSKALIGVRNAMDPEMKEDVENKFKDFRTI